MRLKGPRQRAFLGLAALALLLVAVAVASTGSVPAGAGGTRAPSHRLLDILISLFLVWMAFGAVLFVYLMVLRKDALTDAAAARHKRRPWATVVGVAILVGLLALFVRWFWVDGGRAQGLANRFGPGPGGSSTVGTTAPDEYRPEFATGPVLVVLGLLVVAIAAWIVAYRARRRRLPQLSEPLLPALGEVLDETVDDLRAEQDPRRAVIAAYARMERALAAYGLPRSPAEAPDEYLQRIFADLEVSRLATSRLTALFAWAKFSGHDVVPEMKQQAIEALEAVRNELRAAEIMAEERRSQALAELRERADSR